MRFSTRNVLLSVLVFAVFVGGMTLGGWLKGPSPAAAQTIGDDSRLITTTGNGEIKVAPDICTVVIGVQTEGKTALEAQNANNAAAAAVTGKLRSLGIKEADIRTASFNLYPVYEYTEKELSIQPPGPLVPSGFRSVHRIQVTIRDLAKVSAAIDGSIEAGANTADEIVYGLADSSALRQQALTKAVQDARAKADIIASAAGVSVTEIKSIQENYVDYTYYRLPYAYDKEMASGMGAALPVLPGEVTVRASVGMTVRF